MQKTRNGCLIGLFLLLVSIVLPAMADIPSGDRLDPSLRILVEQALQLPESGVSIRSLLETSSHEFSWSPTAGNEQIDLLIKLDQDFHGTSYHGLPVTVSTGSIVGVSATVQQILAMLKNEDVVYIEPSRRTSATLDVSVPAIGADIVHSAMPAITGEGVIIGAIDTGIDYTHLDFRYDSDGDGFEESSRILSILDQSYGLFAGEYSRQDIETDLINGHGSNEGIVRQKDTDGHGTHVMGIAAGDGSSSSEGFVGVAPGAWIVMVKTTYFTSDILAGIEYIFDLADAWGLPAVVNLSLGGHEGAHDGTSVFEQGIDELVDGPGRVVVVSAGNEGDQLIHVSDTLQGDSSLFYIDPGSWEVELNLWYPGWSRFAITVTGPSGTAVVTDWQTDSGVVATPFGTVRVDNASAGVNPNNGDHEVLIRLGGLSGSDPWMVAVTDTGGGGGRYDAWIINGTGVILNGDSSSTIDEPGNAHDVITVGAFNSKAVWPSLSSDQNFLATHPLGELAYFSSHGPTRDGRTKPDLCAPGAWVAAPLSNDALWYGYLVHPDGVHTMERGTSMAAPHVSGAAALLLSINPQLTAEDVRELLVDTAIRDGSTWSVPNNDWGWGKLDVEAAVGDVAQPDPPPVDPPPSESTLPEITLEENPVATIARFAISFPSGTTIAELRVYSVAGALVYDTAVSVFSNRVDWPLIATQGDSVASGLYLYVLVTDQGTSHVGKLVISR